MTVTSSTIVKGSGSVVMKRITDSRIMWLSFNSKVTFTKSSQAGDAVTGFNSDGNEVTLDQAGDTLTYELDITSKKNTRNMNELVLDSTYVSKTNYEFPHAEAQTVASGTITLVGTTAPSAGKTKVSYLDGTALASTAGTPTAGQYKDNGDGTITFNAGDNGKTVVIAYYMTQTVNVQGGADQSAVGNLEVYFHQVSGTSDVSGKKGVDVLWLPKCTLTGDTSFEFSSAVQDKEFKLTASIPDTPSGFKVPYAWIRGAELNNANAG